MNIYPSFINHKKSKNMNQNILAIFTINTDQLPSHFQEIIQHEQEVVAQWREEGILEHLFLRPTRNGAVLVFKDIDENKAQELMSTLPLFPFMKSVEYLPLLKQF
jgi:muconolactone D-isomerase